MRERLLAALATPQVLVALLLTLGAVALLLGAPRPENPEPVTIELAATEEVLSEQTATLVVVDEVGLERSSTIRLPLPEGPTARLAAVLAELREASMLQGVWPAELPAPRVFLLPLGQGQVAVIDMLVPQPVGVSVEQESAILRSLVTTVQRNGVPEVRFLRNGRPADTLLGHVAVASEL